MDDDDDFKVNVQMFSEVSSNDNDNEHSPESSVNPLKGLQMAEFALNTVELSDKLSENNKLDSKLKGLSISGKDVKSVVNDLSQTAEVLTEDEVDDEIEEDIVDEAIENIKDVRQRSNSKNQHDSERTRSMSTRTISETSRSKHDTNQTRAEHSYTNDFSSGSEVKSQIERSHSYSYSDKKNLTTSKASRSSRKSRASRSSRSSNSSRTSHSSRSSERSRSKSTISEYSKSKVP